jgi:hypothetical protein
MNENLKIDAGIISKKSFAGKKSDRLLRFMDIVDQATRNTWPVNFDGKQITLRPGQLITSTIKLAEQWGWTRSAVRVFLSGLERDKLICIEKSDIVSRKATLLTVLNYDRYDFSDRPKKELSKWQLDVAVVNRRLREINQLDYGDPAFCGMIIKQHGFLLVVAKLEQIAAANTQFRDVAHAKAYVVAALKKIVIDNSTPKPYMKAAYSGDNYDLYPSGEELARQRGNA